MDAIAAIRAARTQRSADEVELRLAPPASADEIAVLEGRLELPLPRELRAVLELTRGIEGPFGPVDDIDFAGEAGAIDVPGMPSAPAIAGDGHGNFWVLDVTPEDRDTVPVFFACHDPPVVLFQSPSLGAFLHETFRMLTPGHESPVADVHGDRPFDVWGTDHGALTREEAIAAGGELALFAHGLEHDEYRLHDLRDPAPGAGFAWGRSRTDEVLRHGHRRIFAVDRRPRRRGLRLPRRH